MTASISTREGAAAGGPNQPSPARPAGADGTRGLRARLRPCVRPALALAAVVLAYRVSLRTLLDDLALDTPLAHLALVPLIALGMMVVGHRRASGPDIHDRQLDWIVGLPLVALALAANLLLPGHLSTEFWVYRIDLVSLPLFVAGVVVLLLGTRVAWRMRLGIAFLFLAWPYPYSQVLDRWLVPFTAVTVKAVTAAVGILTVARPYSGNNTSSLFTVTPRVGVPFDLSVATECSGANGLLGFSLVGLAFVLMLQGRRSGKLLWLAAGGALVWALNVIRILLIFWIGRNWGQKVAIDGFHPYIGLVVFNLGILLMALLLGRFGLRWSEAGPGVAAGGAAPRSSHRPALAAGAVVVAVATFGVGVLNTDLRNYDLVTSSLGTPRLVSFVASQEKPDGWRLQYVTSFDWSKRFFGPDSEWRRYAYTDPNAFATTGDQLHSNAAVIADVITTSDRGAFSAYGIEACYRFHNFRITRRQSVDLGNGVVGGLLTWYDPAARNTTTTLYWHWPIRNGDQTRWERVTLLVVDSPSLTFHNQRPEESLTRDFQLQVRDVLGGDRGTGDEVSARLVATRQYLVSFAQDMIALRGTSSVRPVAAGGGS